MEKFLRKHRFKFILTFVILLFVYVAFYMLWVHVPYANKQNELSQIEHTITQKHKLKDVSYFNEYHSDKTYYVLKHKNKKTQYTIYNTKYKQLDKTNKIVLSKKEATQLFETKYKVKPTKIEVGYENDEIVYCMTYKKGDKLLYAFYGIETGEFLKAYSL